MAVFYKGFQSLLYYKFQFSGRHCVPKAAKAMGISAESLYRYANGGSTFPVDLLPKLYNATKDADFLDAIVNETDQILVPRARVEAATRSIEREALDVSVAVGELQKHLDDALEDGQIDEVEARRIRKSVNRTFREVQELLHKVESI